jgi:8-oxo-dGTP pyrophosphatase MutT (NUDIX family)
MIKESYEEAGLAEDLVANRVIPTGCITYLLDGSNGLLYNNMFVYDLELPRDIQPQNKDNEVEFFELLKVEEVVHELLETPAETWKPDICLVLLDFFIRHGILTPDNFTDYEKLVRALSSTSAMSPYEHPMYRRLA